MDLSVLLSFFLFGSPCCFTRSANPRLVICTISNLSSPISICSPTENFLASRFRMASHILILNPGVDHLDPTFAALVKPKINQVVQPIVDCGDAAFKLQRLCHCRGGDFRQLGSRLKGFLKLVTEWRHAFAVATLADNQKIFFAACAHRFPVYTSASSVKQVKFMGKSIREIPAGWIENPDGSYSKPNGKEILLMMNSAEAKPQLVPNVEKIGITAKSMLDQIQSEEAGLNKTERARLAFLRAQRIPHIEIQAITLKLAFDCRLTPDFSYYQNGVLTLEDVKGFQREDALIKMKVAARKFPMFRFLIVKRNGAGWEENLVRP